jgi:GNAT superfamily N-acetyltransferase
VAEVKIMRTDSEIFETFTLLKQLRPVLLEDEYVEKIKHLQIKYGYTLVAVIESGQVKSASGFRITESLACDKYFYVDDLITDQNSRSNGYAKLLFDWLVKEAEKAGCQQLHLDSGVQRYDAHRFYLNRKMDITCHHFQRNL